MEAQKAVMKNFSASEDKHKRHRQDGKNALLGQNLSSSYQFTSQERFLSLCPTLRKVHFCRVNTDKGRVLFQFLKFMMWLLHSW